MSAISDRLSGMGDIELAHASIALLAAIMEMSDRAQSMGGATSIAGVAALNTLQKSLQSNGVRMSELALEVSGRRS